VRKGANRVAGQARLAPPGVIQGYITEEEKEGGFGTGVRGYNQDEKAKKTRLSQSCVRADTGTRKKKRRSGGKFGEWMKWVPTKGRENTH